MIVWTLRLAWLAVALITIMPVLARWLDPAPAFDPNARTTVPGGLSLMLDVLTMAGHRAWALPAIIALAGLVVLLSGATFGWLALHHAPWPQRRLALWPLLGLGIGLLASILLDENLLEFPR